MPSISVPGRYCLFPYVGASNSTTFRDSTYVNNLCSVGTPSPLGFGLYLSYIPGVTVPGQGLTTLASGSSYQIISRDAYKDVAWSITYAGNNIERLPAAINVQSPLFIIGLDRNSIVVPFSSYVLGDNSPLSSIGFTGTSNGSIYDYVNTQQAADIKKGVYYGNTHFRPNSAYKLRTRVPFTFFAPLKSEMGSVYAVGENLAGQFGMGYRLSNTSFPGDNIYGNWDKIIFNNYSFDCYYNNNQKISAPSIAALSSCGASKALFVLGNNVYGQLGTGSSQQYYPVWTRVPGQWTDVAMGRLHMLAINSQGHLYSCGDSSYGQLGLGKGVRNKTTLTLVDNTKNYVEIAATGYGTMARDSNGFLYACGYNYTGKLGIGNNTLSIYTLTQEILNYTWTSVKAGRINNTSSPDASLDYFVAIRSDNTLFGVGSIGSAQYFGANFTQPSQPYAFRQDDMRFSDVTSVITTLNGTFIQRQSRNNYYAAGDNDDGLGTNPLAIINNNHGLNFLETYIPSDARAIATYYNATTTGIGTSYIRNNIRYSKTSGNSFTQDTNNYINTFTDSFTTFTVGGVLPTPTPTQTPTITPTITVTPSITPTPTTPVFVPSDVPNVIVNARRSTSTKLFAGDDLNWMRSSDGFSTSTTMLNWASLGNFANPTRLYHFCFDFKDANNVVMGTFNVKNTNAGDYSSAYFQIIKHSSTWGITNAVNDIVTGGTMVANFNKTSGIYANGGTFLPVGTMDMFVHRPSNTAVYAFTLGKDFWSASSTDPLGAFSFTVNLADNSISDTATIFDARVCFDRTHINCAQSYKPAAAELIADGQGSKTAKPIRKLIDGTVVFQTLYLTKVPGSRPPYPYYNYAIAAAFGDYRSSTWSGFGNRIGYEIPNSSDDPSTTTNINIPSFSEYARLNGSHYFSWIGKSYNDAQNPTSLGSLYLRNFSTSTQITVSNQIAPGPTKGFDTEGSNLIKQYDILGIPVINKIYVVYVKYISGTVGSSDLVTRIYLNRYNEDLTLVDSTNLFEWSNTISTPGEPAIIVPQLSFYVNNNKELKLILSFGAIVSSIIGNSVGASSDREYILTNIPSINNTWTTVLNRSAFNEGVDIGSAGQRIITI